MFNQRNVLNDTYAQPHINLAKCKCITRVKNLNNKFFFQNFLLLSTVILKLLVYIQ